MKFLNIRMLFCLLCLAMVTITGCDEQEMNDTNDCIVGVIISDDIYKNIYEGCYNNSLWIEVLNNESIGKDITIFTPAPTLHPNSPIEYRNVIEVLMPDQIYQNNRKDTLSGKEIYFQYKTANENEINEIRNNECSEVYETHDVPIIRLTDFSFIKCPS